MLVDIDRFDAFNRRFGAAAGDSLLRLIGSRIRRQLRATDTTARLDADRFALILEELARPEHAGAVARKLLAAIALPLAIADQTVTVTASAGAAIYPENATEADRLLALAAAALDSAKLEGGHRFRPPPGGPMSSSADDQELATALERAVNADGLGLLFQPQVTLRSAELGLAAVMHWPRRSGSIGDERIRALALDAGLAEPLTDWLLAAACRQAGQWRGGGLPALHVAIPLLSRRPLVWGDLARRLERHLAQAALTPAELELEIDEPLLLDPHAAPARPLAAMRELGVRLAIAGYGSGPTPLGALRDLPLSTVKLARAALAGVPEDRARTAIVGGIVRLAGELGLRVVADGVETQAQLQLLRQLGCDAVQTPICCPPLPPGACADWLREAAKRA
jgi:diguanylate cyclase (GGDEF)-like protein